MKSVFKIILTSFGANMIRLAKIFPNADPILSFSIPASKKYNPLFGAFLAFFTMFVFDLITGYGNHTWVTSITYGLIVLSFSLFKNKKSSFKNYLSLGVYGVLVFDFITGPVFSSYLFGQPFLTTLYLQIPFTILHLISSSTFIVLISPLLDEELMKEAQTYINLVFKTMKKDLKLLFK